MTTNEEMLLHMIHGTIEGIEIKIQRIKNIPEDLEIPGFDAGKLVGYLHAMNAFKASLDFYERWKRGEMPGERIELFEKNNLPEKQ